MGSTRTGAEVVVIGAGVMGAWTALQAKRQGWRTTLIDAFGAGHSRATSGDESRIIRSSHGADPFYGRWSREAREAWIVLGDAVGEPLFVPVGALWFARAADGFEAASEGTLRELGIPVERLSPAELTARWPQLKADDLAFAIYEPEAGLLMARRGVAAVARQWCGTTNTYCQANNAYGFADGHIGGGVNTWATSGCLNFLSYTAFASPGS